jgi:hypothetical protein
LLWRETEGAKASAWRRRRGRRERRVDTLYRCGRVGWRIWGVHRGAAFIEAFRGIGQSDRDSFRGGPWPTNQRLLPFGLLACNCNLSGLSFVTLVSGPHVRLPVNPNPWIPPRLLRLALDSNPSSLSCGCRCCCRCNGGHSGRRARGERRARRRPPTRQLRRRRHWARSSRVRSQVSKLEYSLPLPLSN